MPETKFPDTHDCGNTDSDQQHIREPVMQETGKFAGIAVDIRTEGGIIKGKLILVHSEILYQNERNKIKILLH